jgi:Nif-specific regulatory protein
MPEPFPIALGAVVSEPDTLRALLEASAVMNASLDMEAVLDAIARSAAEVLGAEASSVLLLDETGRKLVFKAAAGSSAAELKGMAFEAELGIAGGVASSGRAELVEDVRHHPRFYPGIDEKLAFTTRGLMAAPLQYRGRVLGVVEVVNPRAGRRFGPRDLELLQVFANLGAISAFNAQHYQGLKLENRSLRESAAGGDTIVGQSAALREALALCDRVAPTNATVLLLGETGTGKELSARRLHAHSQRSERPFVAINCAALPETLLESELFGHEAGAFTGAVGRKLGRFELAHHGTLFLDEIGDISPSTQTKLLRVLQEREFVRVGGTTTLTCDVRIVAATNRDLKRAMERGAFREDLYYRLNVFPIQLPPLRARRDDIRPLVEHFVQRYAREFGRAAPPVSPEAFERLEAYGWPGNIREMRNVIERAVLLCDGGRIEPAQLPSEIVGAPAGEPQPSAGDLENYEKAMIIQALESHEWNQTRAAEALGISRDNLRYRLRKYRIERPDDEAS